MQFFYLKKFLISNWFDMYNEDQILTQGLNSWSGIEKGHHETDIKFATFIFHINDSQLQYLCKMSQPLQKSKTNNVLPSMSV